jgi:hypothetical protein
MLTSFSCVIERPVLRLRTLAGSHLTDRFLVAFAIMAGYSLRT